MFRSAPSLHDFYKQKKTNETVWASWLCSMFYCQNFASVENTHIEKTHSIAMYFAVFKINDVRPVAHL